MKDKAKYRIAVLIPCYNEEKTVSKVIQGFRKELSKLENIETEIYVYDNNSTDRTVEEAEKAGARVKIIYSKGKANVMREMFRDIDADYYIMVDGDDTYDPSVSVDMVDMAVNRGFDIVNCVRVEVSGKSYRRLHKFGNKILNLALYLLFKKEFKDMLSGYKIMSRRFVKSLPVLSEGFDIETEIAIHALELKCSIGYINGPYRERPEGSYSKLNTFKDGFKIIRLIFNMFRHEKPLIFFSILGFMISGVSLSLGIPVIQEYMDTGKVPRLPTAVLAASTGIIAALMFLAGVILDTVTRGRKELRMLFFLNQRR